MNVRIVRMFSATALLLLLALVLVPGSVRAAWLTYDGQVLSSAPRYGEFFGASVDVDGDTLVVGTLDGYDPGDSYSDGPGSAYVYVHDGTSWQFQARLQASDRVNGDGFGYSVAIDGDTVVVGSRWDDNAAGPNAGAAYVFTRSGTLWTEAAKLTEAGSGTASDDEYGASVDIDGGTIVVGAYRDGDLSGGSDSGAVYAYTGSGSSWSLQSKFQGADTVTGDLFAAQVAISGDTIVAGALRDDAPGVADAGAAYVFTRSGSTWSQQQKLTAAVRSYNLFTRDVDIDGDRIAIAAPWESYGSLSRAGAVYIYERSGSTWTQASVVRRDAPASYGYFGMVVSLHGSHLLTAQAAGSGAMIMLKACQGQWLEKQVLTVSGTYKLGSGEVALGASHAAGGDWYGLSRRGAAYTWSVDDSLSLAAPAAVTLEADTAGSPGSKDHTLSWTVTDGNSQATSLHVYVDGTLEETISVAAGGGSVNFTHTYSVGEHRVMGRVEDAVNGLQDVCATTVTVVDTTPPVGTCSLVRSVLWPPRGAMLPVGFQATFVDAIDGTLAPGSVVVYSSQPNGSAPFTPDATWINGLLRLRAERAWTINPGRVYLIVASATDAAGNTGYACCSAIVPRMPTAYFLTQTLLQATAARTSCENSGTGDPGSYTQVTP